MVTATPATVGGRECPPQGSTSDEMICTSPPFESGYVSGRRARAPAGDVLVQMYLLPGRTRDQRRGNNAGHPSNAVLIPIRIYWRKDLFETSPPHARQGTSSLRRTGVLDRIVRYVQELRCGGSGPPHKAYP